MTEPRAGSKGPELEEALKAYFWRAGYFVVRGVPYRVGDDDVTDIDLWLYERPAALTRRRLIVDAKNKQRPKASERIIWCRGLQDALNVDGVIVATTDQRESARRLAQTVGVTLLDGDAVSKLLQSEKLHQETQLFSNELDALVKKSTKAVDPPSGGKRYMRREHRYSRASVLNLRIRIYARPAFLRNKLFLLKQSRNKPR